MATDYFELLQDFTVRHIGQVCKPRKTMYCPTCDEEREPDPIDVVMGTVPSCTECGEFLTEKGKSNGE